MLQSDGVNVVSNGGTGGGGGTIQNISRPGTPQGPNGAYYNNIPGTNQIQNQNHTLRSPLPNHFFQHRRSPNLCQTQDLNFSPKLYPTAT